MLDYFRARRARAEVMEHFFGDPRVVLLPRQDPPGHEVRREELGQRRRDGLDETSLAHELDVPVAGEAHARQHRAARRHFLTIETDALGQPQPELQAALAGDVAVVISNAADPHPPERGVVRLGQDDRVLDRHARLIVVAIEHPLLQLHPRELAVVHQMVIAVMIVVAVLALAPHPLDELVTWQRGPHGLLAHSRTSMPSHATSQPAAPTASRSGESSRSNGFVLLRWM